jgi:uncharacterized damage-inducible protein DinB
MMAVTRESLLEHYRTMRAALMASIEELSDAQLQETTIDGWSVKDNLAHIAFWDDLRADEVTRISAGHQSVLRMTEQQDHDLNEMMYELRRGLTLSQVMWELQHSGERLLAAIEAAPRAALDEALYGEAGLLSTHGVQHAEYISNWRKAKSY